MIDELCKKCIAIRGRFPPFWLVSRPKNLAQYLRRYGYPREKGQARVHLERRQSRGYTIGEMLMVIVILGLLTYIAVPAMRTFTGSNDDLSAATRITHTINRAKDQSRRRNRAYVVDFVELVSAAPGGRVDILETRGTSCQSASDSIFVAGGADIIYSMPVGGTEVADYKGPNEAHIGLVGWRTSRDGAYSSRRVRLCIAPDGATSIIRARGSAEPLAGRFELLVQRYARSEEARKEGVGRRIKMSFMGPARLVMD
jgi:type II secretory pathway pseudopilin PulG